MCEIESSPCGEKGVCIPNYQDNSAQCKCQDGYVGKPCGMYPRIPTLDNLITRENITELNINLTLNTTKAIKHNKKPFKHNNTYAFD